MQPNRASGAWTGLPERPARTGGITERSAIRVWNVIRHADGAERAVRSGHPLPVGPSAPARQEQWHQNVGAAGPGCCGGCVRQETRDGRRRGEHVGSPGWPTTRTLGVPSCSAPSLPAAS